jgi:phenylpropionate dioxygenase-like ring-hydroxylating dioxygenase large terminal subunit
MTGSFVRNAWYVAAWQSEVGAQPFAATIIGEPVVLFRGADGGIRALEDMCPHRFAPLHRGSVVGDAIQCGYHGLTFDGTGRCVHNPVGGGTIPNAARLRAYPVVERDLIVWLWMGDPARADPAAIPDFAWLTNGEAYVFTDQHVMVQPVGYELIVDNLLDLTHGAFLHPTTLGNATLARGTAEVRQVGQRIHYDRWNPAGNPVALFQAAGVAGANDIVDYWNDMRWDPPGAFYLEIGITPTGQSREEGVRMGTVHLLTPIDETTTIYRWVIFRNFAKEDGEITHQIEKLVEYAFREEDEPMLRAVQERMAGKDFWEMSPLLMPGDKAAVLARRTLRRLLDADQDAQAQAPTRIEAA